MPARPLPLWAAAPAKILCSLVLVLVGTQALESVGTLHEAQERARGWEEAREYSVLYPLLDGDDSGVFDEEAGTEDMMTSFARTLYPVLDQAGALYIETYQYEPGPAPAEEEGLTRSLLVNTNYLTRFPLLGEDGEPISVDPSERAWVVAAPASLKDREEELREAFTTSRLGDEEREGAVQAQEAVGEPVPEHLRNQEVSIIWTAPGQDVFTFNSHVNPYSNNMVRDPVLEIMTPSNSMTYDWMNVVTGDVNTSSLKILTGGDNESAYQDLLPLLQQAGIDDNLPGLVSADEAISTEIDTARRNLSRELAVTVASLVLTLLLGALLATTRLNRSRGRAASHPRTMTRRGLLRVLAASWTVTLAAALAATALSATHAADWLRAVTAGTISPVPLSATSLPVLLAAVALTAVLDIAAAVPTARLTHRTLPARASEQQHTAGR